MHTRQHHPLLCRIRRLSCLAGFSLLCLSACAAPAGETPGAPKAAPKQTASQALWQQIQTEVGDAACEGPQQCRSIAVGAKACGGPDSYLAWSTQRSDEQRLRALVDQHAQARRDENRAAGRMSDCRLVTDPGASCQAGRCSLNKHNDGNSGSHLAK